MCALSLQDNVRNQKNLEVDHYLLKTNDLTKPWHCESTARIIIIGKRLHALGITNETHHLRYVFCLEKFLQGVPGPEFHIRITFSALRFKAVHPAPSPRAGQSRQYRLYLQRLLPLSSQCSSPVSPSLLKESAATTSNPVPSR